MTKSLLNGMLQRYADGAKTLFAKMSIKSFITNLLTVDLKLFKNKILLW